MPPQLFIDMDGVLADFDSRYEREFGEKNDPVADNVDWERVRAVEGFFRDLDPMPGAIEMWRELRLYAPVILTGTPTPLPYVAYEKREWVDRHLGEHVPMIACKSSDKYAIGKPGDVLIDDRAKCGDPWVAMGGVWIKHDSVRRTAPEVKRRLGPPRWKPRYTIHLFDERGQPAQKWEGATNLAVNVDERPLSFDLPGGWTVWLPQKIAVGVREHPVGYSEQWQSHAQTYRTSIQHEFIAGKVADACTVCGMPRSFHRG